MNKNAIYFILFLKKNNDPRHYAMLYWSLKTLSNFYDKSYDVIIFYDSNIENFELENFSINKCNIVKDFPFVKFIKLNYYNLYKNLKDPFNRKNNHFFSNHSNIWMFKWFALKEIFEMNYQNVLYLDADTIFYKNPNIIFNFCIKNNDKIYVKFESRTHPILENRKINQGHGINAGQLYISKFNFNKIKSFYDEYYNTRLSLSEEAKMLLLNNEIDEQYYEKFTAFNEQHALIVLFSYYNIPTHHFPYHLISLKKEDYNKMEQKLIPCVHHYEKDIFAHSILPQELYTKLIHKQKLRNI